MKEEEIKYLYEKGIPIYKAKGDSDNIFTGAWKTYKPKIDYEKCIKCKLCWLLCPDSAIEWKNKPVIIDVSQAVLKEHDNATKYLYRDIQNLTFFFKKLGVATTDPKDVVKHILSIGE